nr:phage antirepressor KilAC domain-containing protein [Prevotella disiens]
MTFTNPQFGEIRTAGNAENPLFCLADLCQALDIKNPSDCKSRLRKKGIVITDTPTRGGMQQMIFVNEGNLYRCVFQSRKPDAEQFQDWICEDVIPTIRKNGAYSLTKKVPSSYKEALVALVEEIEEKEKLEEQLNHQQPKVDYYDKVLNSTSTMTTGQVAACFGMSAIALNKKLCAINMQYKQSGMYFLKHPYSSYHLSDVRTYPYNKADGTIGTKQYLVWNERGKEFLCLLHENNFDVRETRNKISPEFWIRMLRPQCLPSTDK